MIKEFEKQIILTKKANEVIDEIKKYTDEINAMNEKNLLEIKDIVVKDMEEIVEYCIKMGIPKDKEGWSSPSERVVITDNGDDSIEFKIIYDRKKDLYEWYIGICKSGIGYAICNGLFCCDNSFSNLHPVWSYGFLSHHNTESATVQYICTNWKDIRTKIVNTIANRISDRNEKNIIEANNILNKTVSKLVDSNNALNEFGGMDMNIEIEEVES